MRKKEESGNRSLYWQPMVSLWPAYGQLMEDFRTILDRDAKTHSGVRVMFTARDELHLRASQMQNSVNLIISLSVCGFQFLRYDFYFVCVLCGQFVFVSMYM